MKNKFYIKLLLFLVSTVTVFHLCIMVKLIPYDIAWGGHIESDDEMYIFEIISVFINLFLILVLLMKANYIKFQFNMKTINIVLWIFFSLFILNTFGNILAKSTFEKSFSVLTLVMAFSIWNILRKKTINN